jgi:uncharacterized protein involved in type VI secretion and phage assembly
VSDIVQLIRQIVQAELSRQVSSHIGVVEAVKAHADPSDLVNYGCDVRLRGREIVLKDVPLLADHLGTVSPPAVGDVVLVQFVAGQPEAPVVVGRLFSDQLQPPPYDQGQIVTFLPPGAEESDRVEIQVQGGKNGSRSLTLKLPSDLTVTITDKKVEAKVGEMTLLIDGEGKTAALKSGDKASVELADDKLTLKANGDITIDSSGNVKITAKSGLTLEATGDAQLKGANVTAEAQAQLSLKASGPAELKGAVVNIN